MQQAVHRIFMRLLKAGKETFIFILAVLHTILLLGGKQNSTLPSPTTGQRKRLIGSTVIITGFGVYRNIGDDSAFSL